MLMLVLLWFLVLAPGIVHGDSELFEDLNRQYLSLRNTDSRLERESAWQELAQQLVSFASLNKDSDKSPRALLNAAIISQQFYEKNFDQESFSRYEALLEQIYSDYSSSEIAPQALIMQAESALSWFNDEVKAIHLLNLVTELYPRSPYHEAARIRKEQLLEKSGSDQTPDRLIEASRSDEPARGGDKIVVVIDPGHGGEDFGAVGQGGLLEKDVALDVAFSLRRMLETELGAVVRLTREQDAFVPLLERTQFANDFEADVFISLHANASPSNRASGFETYYLDNTDNQASRRLAERENKSLQLEEGTQSDLTYILSDLIQTSKLEESRLLASKVQKSTINHLRANWPQVRDLGVKKAPFYVLVGAHMPCILIEMFFIDHPEDGSRLADGKFRKEIARGIFLGLSKFLEKTGDKG